MFIKDRLIISKMWVGLKGNSFLNNSAGIIPLKLNLLKSFNKINSDHHYPSLKSDEIRSLRRLENNEEIIRGINCMFHKWTFILFEITHFCHKQN